LITKVSSNPQRFAARCFKQGNTDMGVAAKQKCNAREKTSKFTKCCGENVEKKKGRSGDKPTPAFKNVWTAWRIRRIP
jgi:hypothetical protein